jgi:quercetin dioxygenase-like cupin family protein
MKIRNVQQLLEESVTHNPEVKKKVLIRNGEIPHLMMFGNATLKPGQTIGRHKHETMAEVFYILSGKAMFHLGDQEVEVHPGDCITSEPNEEHGQTNPFNEEVTWLYFGIATDL